MNPQGPGHLEECIFANRPAARTPGNAHTTGEIRYCRLRRRLRAWGELEVEFTGDSAEVFDGVAFVNSQ